MVFILFLHSSQTRILVNLEGSTLDGKYVYCWALGFEIDFQKWTSVAPALLCNDPYNCFPAIIQQYLSKCRVGSQSPFRPWCLWEDMTKMTP